MTNHGYLAMTLRSKPDHPKTEKNHVKFGQMWRFCSLFSSIVMAWWIISSCPKVVRSIRNTTFKLCADCTKQFARNAQNYGKTKHGFGIIVTHQLTHRCLCMSFWPKKNRRHASTIVFTGLGNRWPFSIPKTEDTDERQAFFYDWEDKREIESAAVGAFQKGFEDWKTFWHISVL